MGCPPSRDARNGGDLAMHGSPTAKPSWDLRDQYSGRGAMARCRAAHATHDRSYHPAGDRSVVQNADYNRRFAFSAFTTPFTHAIAATPPRAGSEVEAAIAPLNRAVQDLLTDPDVRTAMSQLEETMASAEEALARLVADPEPASLTELVEELKRTVKISMPAALLGAAGIV
jgi:hypothetical protein